MFATYFQLGVEHILDLKAYDHILFIVSICLLADFKSIKKLVWLVTAFTIGHSLTLALSAVDILRIPAMIVETAIPITIILSCIDNIVQVQKKAALKARFILILLFGFIHGMGFSSFFKSILGKEESIVWPLLSFNLGVEAAQLIIVVLTLFFLSILYRLKIKRSPVVITISVFIILISLYLLVNVISG